MSMSVPADSSFIPVINLPPIATSLASLSSSLSMPNSSPSLSDLDSQLSEEYHGHFKDQTMAKIYRAIDLFKAARVRLRPSPSPFISSLAQRAT